MNQAAEMYPAHLDHEMRGGRYPAHPLHEVEGDSLRNEDGAGGTSQNTERLTVPHGVTIADTPSHLKPRSSGEPDMV